MILRHLAGREEPVGLKNLVRKFSHMASEQKIRDRVHRMVQSGVILETPSRKLKVPRSKQEHLVLKGRVDMTAKGSAYVVVEGLEEDVYVPESRMGRAFDGDSVRVVIRKRKGKRRAEGEIVEVLARAKEHYVGSLEMNRGYAFVVPLHRKGMRDIFIPPDELNQVTRVSSGDRVAVEIIEWPHRSSNPIGRIAYVLGPAEENDTEMRSILLSNGFPLTFPPEAMAEAEAFPDAPTAEDLAERLDLRDIETVTIDPVDAKDFDDALSYRDLGNGRYEVGIHIADVAHFVRPGSALDKEAYKRATSVYLVDRVNPMLPERLSNGLCSLRPREDKHAFSALFELDGQGQVLKEWYGRTLIHSDHRFAYEEAQEVLDGGEGPHRDALLQLNRLAEALRAKRFENGSVNFETEEVRFKLDEDGKPLGIYLKERKAAHMLVEDFMLLANRRVAMFLSQQARQSGDAARPAVYRVHDQPDPEKLKAFEALVQEYGHKLRLPDNPAELPKAINAFMQVIQGQPEQDVLSRMAIRSMAKAVYTTDNIGHFGLGFEDYTHFTSPIRRYPDVMVHRLLDQALNKSKQRPDKHQLEAACQHCSQMERKAMDAEYESIKYKQAEYLQDHVGEEFAGRVSGITTWGIFVELNESRCEGMIRLDSVAAEFVHDAKKNTLYAVDIDRWFRMGDPVRIRVEGISLERREMNFALLDAAVEEA
jgi:ribonuclease R